MSDPEPESAPELGGETPPRRLSLHRRVFAALVDIGIANVVVVLGWHTGVLPSDVAGRLVWAGLMLVRDVFGRSPGKQLAGLAVESEYGGPVTAGKRLLRNAPLILPILLPVEYVVVRFSNDGRRLGDRMAKTRLADLDPERPDTPYFWYGLALWLMWFGFLATPIYLSNLDKAKDIAAQAEREQQREHADTTDTIDGVVIQEYRPSAP